MLLFINYINKLIITIQTICLSTTNLGTTLQGTCEILLTIFNNSFPVVLVI